MIGNMDWLFMISYNLVLFCNFVGGVILVLYDFDFVGLVNINYVWFNDFLLIVNVKEWYFMGNYLSLELLRLVI